MEVSLPYQYRDKTTDRRGGKMKCFITKTILLHFLQQFPPIESQKFSGKKIAVTVLQNGKPIQSREGFCKSAKTQNGFWVIDFEDGGHMWEDEARRFKIEVENQN